MSDTYPHPPHGWTCFHCGETFHTAWLARQHFGATPGAEPGCMIRVKYGDERGLQTALREAEEQLARYRAEDSDTERAMHAMRADHATELRRAEELGYERGLRDALSASPTTPAAARGPNE